MAVKNQNGCLLRRWQATLVLIISSTLCRRLIFTCIVSPSLQSFSYYGNRVGRLVITCKNQCCPCTCKVSSLFAYYGSSKISGYYINGSQWFHDFENLLFESTKISFERSWKWNYLKKTKREILRESLKQTIISIDKENESKSRHRLDHGFPFYDLLNLWIFFFKSLPSFYANKLNADASNGWFDNQMKKPRVPIRFKAETQRWWTPISLFKSTLLPILKRDETRSLQMLSHYKVNHSGFFLLRRQIALADLVIINKTDLIDETGLGSLISEIRWVLKIRLWHHNMGYWNPSALCKTYNIWREWKALTLFVRYLKVAMPIGFLY